MIKVQTKYFPQRAVKYIHGMPEQEWYRKEYVRLGKKKYTKKYCDWMRTKTPHRKGSRAFEALGEYTRKYT